MFNLNSEMLAPIRPAHSMSVIASKSFCVCFYVNGLRLAGSVLFLQLLNITNRFSVLGCLRKASQNVLLCIRFLTFSVFKLLRSSKVLKGSLWCFFGE